MRRNRQAGRGGDQMEQLWVTPEECSSSVSTCCRYSDSAEDWHLLLRCDWYEQLNADAAQKNCANILPAAMRRAPPSLHSLWLMKGTPQTSRKPPARAAARPRIISKVQKPRNTGGNTAITYGKFNQLWITGFKKQKRASTSTFQLRCLSSLPPMWQVQYLL